MPVWLTRGGRDGEYEEKFLSDQRIYLTWREFNESLADVRDKGVLRAVIASKMPEASQGRISQNTAQIWAFCNRMRPGDLVIMPRKRRGVLAVGIVKGNYEFDASASAPYWHSRQVQWTRSDVPRASLDQDLLHSLNAFTTICEISRGNAEERLRLLLGSGDGTRAIGGAGVLPAAPEPGEDEAPHALEDLERSGKDNIRTLLSKKFRSHNLARLVEAILIADGYATFLSPPGPDKGVDILASPGALGFGSPRVCVQVKSGDDPVSRTVLDQLNGVMQRVHAEQGLLVSLGGFRDSVWAEEATQFFRVRLWDADALIDALLRTYERLPAEIRAELPLKRVWTVATEDDE